MVEYSHFERSAPCASPGYYVGRKGSEVQIANASGRLFQAGSAITVGGGSAGTYRIAAGNVSASPSATIDTGLTTVTYAVCNILGRCPDTDGTSGTLDSTNTPDSAIDTRHPSICQWRIVSTNDLWVKAYQLTAGGAEATFDSAQTRCTITYIAFGT